MNLYRRGGKRVLDLLIVLPVFLLSLPVQLAIGVVVRLKFGTPVLFRQQRPGRGGKPFTMVKFRTMTDERDQHGHLLPDADRLPTFGAILRSTSLDELPELYNVVKGDMSIVGPRPLLVAYLERYTPRQARRHEVRPGVTGLAQTSGRNTLTWEEKFELDVEYVDNVSLALDLRILWRTALGVVRREGTAAEGHATAPEFMGAAEHSE